MGKTTAGASLAFRWSYITLPLVMLLLAIISTAYFYRLLPAEVAYHFQSDGSPDKWLSRGAITLWMLLPQLFFTLFAAAITWIITRLGSRFRQPEKPVLRPGKILLVIGNMVALPQIILGFAMLDIFSYNSYQIRFLPLWAFTLIVVGASSLILGTFFIQAVRRIWGASKE